MSEESGRIVNVSLFERFSRKCGYRKLQYSTCSLDFWVKPVADVPRLVLYGSVHPFGGIVCGKDTLVHPVDILL
ncbi:hypothetical protein AB6A40_011131 [Gnathostoma spinigerum]|uniref:Recombination activating protein 2 n=1 Tax=Gnathostoma spinigerum TaxID=75299 RepID=A0ABD6F3M0_9BILA